MNRNRIALALLSLLLARGAAAADYEIDGSHSAAQFSVRHLMISNVKGEFGKTSGTVSYDGKDVKSVVADVSVDVASINTREPKRDEHLKSPDFFDVAKFPAMTFKSKKAEAAGQGAFKLTGDLTIHGVTKEVTFAVTGPTPETKDPWGNTRVGASATTTIDRKAFGLTWNKALETGGVLVGDEVAITLDLEAVKKGAEAPKK